MTYTHRFLGSVMLAWADIEAVSYWSSFAQGGARIRGRSGRKIRVYRWIARYAMLDRLMHDRLDSKVFWPTLTLPLRVDLNRRRRLGVIAPYMLLRMNVLELLWQGNLVTFAVVSAIPSFVAAALIWGSSRSLEFDKDGVRDIWRYMWFEKVNAFRRTDLQEARLGRPLTVGGLWMRLGDTRLEIANTERQPPVRAASYLPARELGVGAGPSPGGPAARGGVESPLMDAAQAGPPIEILVECQDRRHAPLFHHSDMNGVTRGHLGWHPRDL
jgi:hypothetical protein